MSLHNAEDLAQGTARDPKSPPPSGALSAAVEERQTETGARHAVLLTSIRARKEGLTVYALAQKHGWAYGHVRSLVFDLAEKGLVHPEGDRWVEGPGVAAFSRPLELEVVHPSPAVLSDSAAIPPAPLPPRSPVARRTGTTPESLLEGARVREARGNRAQHEVALAVVRAMGGDGNAASVANLLGRIERGLDVGGSRYLPVIYEVLGLSSPGGPEARPVVPEVATGSTSSGGEGEVTQALSLTSVPPTSPEVDDVDERGSPPDGDRSGLGDAVARSEGAALRGGAEDQPLGDLPVAPAEPAVVSEAGDREAAGEAACSEAHRDLPGLPREEGGAEEGGGGDVLGQRRDLEAPGVDLLSRLLEAEETLRQARFEISARVADDILERALDEIAALCGCPTWEYAGQVVRDVKMVLEQRDAARAELAALRSRLLVLGGGGS